MGKIQSALHKVSGVKNAQVNLLDKTLYIEYLDEKLDTQVIAEIEKLGFGASLDKLVEQKVNVWINIVLPLICGVF